MENNKEKSPFEIVVKYKLNTGTEWNQLDFLPEEYFELEPGEIPEIDSVPKNLEIAEYLPYSISEIAYLQLILHDIAKDKRLQILESFWNKGENRIIEISEYVSQKKVRNEVIHQTVISTDPFDLEMLRYYKHESYNELLFHKVITTHTNGSQSEKRIFPEDSC